MPDKPLPFVEPEPRPGFWPSAAGVLVLALLMWFAAAVLWYNFLLSAAQGRLGDLLTNHPLDPLWLVGFTLVGIALTVMLRGGLRQSRD